MASAESEGKIRDLGFAFNDQDFSDRILRLEMVGDSLGSESHSDGSDTEHITENLSKRQKTAVLEEKGDVAYDYHSKCSTKVEVKTLHIISAVLAASSSFFYKLFKNGMRESQQKDVTLRIKASEEAAMMDLCKFMYSNTLSATSAPELVGVLIMADKFEVSSCTSYCCEQLKKMPLSLESALLCVELPSSVSESVVVKPLLDSAKKYVAMRYWDVTISAKSQGEVMDLPLSAIEVVLGRYGQCGRQVKSEDDVYDFILLWGRARYPNQKERRAILTKLLGRVLHFPYLCMARLEQIQECPDLDSKEVSKLILNSLYLNSGFPYGQPDHFSAAASRQSINRGYTHLPIKAVQRESRYVVYLNLTKEECWDIMDSDEGQYSQPFLIRGYWFALYVEGKADWEEGNLGLFVKMQQEEDDGTCCMFDYEIAVMKASSKGFKCLHKDDNCTLTWGQRVGSEKVFQVPSADYFKHCSRSECVIGGVVRAEFTIINFQA